MSLSLALVDDKPGEVASLALLLEVGGHQVAAFSDPREALDHLGTEPVDVLITDLHMPQMGGIELTAAARRLRPDLEVVVITAFGSIDTAVEAMKQGAAHYLIKSPSLGDELLLTLDRLAGQVALRREIAELRGDAGDGADRLAGLVGRSDAMREVFRLLRAVAGHDVTVLVLGETGTGKELAARALHRLSERRDGPFVAVNCAALPEALVESELFGHVRGAFTGAGAARDGRVHAARGGTLFLDEVGDLPAAMQPKLLRLLEERRYAPVGSDSEREADVRIVAATNRDLEAMADEGTFRLDLYHRLNVVTVPLPPLRERLGDLADLANVLIRRVADRLGVPPRPLGDDALEAMRRYPWPGNVRELHNALERATVVGQGERVSAADLPASVTGAAAPPPAPSAGGPVGDNLADHERAIIARVLRDTGGNIHESARRLGISRPTLYSKISKHGLRRDG